jgi:lysophospholipase L1-like esterase
MATPLPPSPNAPLYIALGDSLSYGEAASDRLTTAFVPLVAASLPTGTGLLNLGHSGDDSDEITRHGHLDQAVAEIASRNRDADPGNNVVLVTLEIGGNDLLDLFFDYVLPGTCPTLSESLQRQECIGILQETLTNFEPNLTEIVDRLLAADPDLNLVLMTLYNPFSGKIDSLDPFGVLSLEGMPDTPFPQGINDIVRAKALAGGIKLADVYPLFEGRALQYVSQDIIHPNDTGYRVMADAVIAVLNP